RREPAPTGCGTKPPPATPRVTGPATPGQTLDCRGDARNYHQATKHSWTSVRSSPHALDWANKPFLFKVYPDAPAVPLPREVAPPGRPTLEALAEGAVSDGRGRVDLAVLTQLLFFSAGITKRKV